MSLKGRETIEIYFCVQKYTTETRPETYYLKSYGKTLLAERGGTVTVGGDEPGLYRTC